MVDVIGFIHINFFFQFSPSLVCVCFSFIKEKVYGIYENNNLLLQGYHFKTGQKLLHIKELCKRIFKNTLIHQKVEVFTSPKCYINSVVTLFIKVPECNLPAQLQSQINSIEIWVYHWIYSTQSAQNGLRFQLWQDKLNFGIFWDKVMYRVQNPNFTLL